jgi:hypothetical protein
VAPEPHQASPPGQEMMLQLMAQQSRILEQLANPRAVLDTTHGGSSKSTSGPSDQEKLRSTTPEFSKINGPEHPDAGERLFDWLAAGDRDLRHLCGSPGLVGPCGRISHRGLQSVQRPNPLTG